MSANIESTPRFLRPADVARLRRNHRRVQTQRVLIIARNVVIGVLVVVTATWLYHRTQSDARFAVRHIEVSGAVHTTHASLDDITNRYVGMNLFRIDISRVQRDIGALPWVRRVDIQKNLPDTLRIDISERQPVALVRSLDRLQYVDVDGVTIAPLTPTTGDDDLPVISGAAGGEELNRSIAFVVGLRAHDGEALKRISEVRPVAPRGFALFDRELAAVVYVNDGELTRKLRQLDSIVRAEGLGRASVAYADLRFNDRIIVKPNRPVVVAAQNQRAVPAALITN
jgi:cell division septal protein FtsQ